MKLHGRTAIITGAGRGIGRAIALAYASEGADVVLTARTQAEIEAVAQEVRALGRRALAVPADARREADVTLVVRRGLEAFGKLDVLVNNAGVTSTVIPVEQRRVISIPTELWDVVIETNVRGPFLFAKAVLSNMIEQRYGSIIGISSALGKHAIGGSAAYCTSKFALEGFTQSLAAEVKEFGIRANTMWPAGMVDTRAIASLPAERRANALPPEHMGPCAVWLATDESVDVTGEAIEVGKWNREHGLHFAPATSASMTGG